MYKSYEDEVKIEKRSALRQIDDLIETQKEIDEENRRARIDRLFDEIAGKMLEEPRIPCQSSKIAV